MSNSIKFPLVIALATTAGAAAFADGMTYGSASLSYFDLDGIDATVVNGAADYISGAFSLTGSVMSASVEDVDASAFQLTGGYSIMPGMTVYALLGYVEIEGYSESSYGLGAEYQTGDYGVGLQYETLDDIDSISLAGYAKFAASSVYGYANDTEDYGTYGLGYQYDAGQLEGNVATMWGEEGFDSGLTSLSGSVDFSSQITGIASVMTSNEDFLDAGLYTIGGRYKFTRTVSLEAHYGASFGGGSYDADGFGFKLKIETGDRRVRVMDQVTDYATDSTPLFDILSD